MKKIIKNKNTYLYAASFAIPFLIISVFFAIFDVYPFGEKLFLVHDLNGQYISFFSYLKDMAANGNNFFYSFSQVFGLDLAGVASYYLLSPFNILIFLIKNTELAATLIIMLKIASSGLTFFTFLSRKYKPSVRNVVFSSMYSLCAYNLVYSHNLMWLDGVIFLPIIALGIDILFKKSKPWVYLISLGIGIFANYYIGYMLCLFSLCYFVGKLTMRFEQIKELKIIIAKFIASSACAGFASAVVIFPTAAQLAGGKTEVGVSDYAEMELDIFFSKLCTGSYDLGQQHYGANIYCTIAAVVLLITYFFNKRISNREKIFSGMSMLLLSLSLMIPHIQSIWHLFSKTDGFPNRQAFVFCFAMIYLAYRSFINRNAIPFYAYIAAGGIVACVGIFLLTKEFTYLPKNMIIISIALGLVTTVLLSLEKENLRRYAAFGLIIIVYGDLSINSYRTLSQFEFCDSNEYYEYTDRVSAAVDAVKEYDDGFYRMEKTFLRNFVNRTWNEIDRNDPMHFSYNGLTSFNSSQKQFVKDFCESVGFTSFHQWSCYGEGTTYSADVLFGVKYIMDKGTRFDGVYQKVLTSGDVGIYQNPASLSIVFSADEAVDLNNLDNLNAFEIQNSMFKTILGYGEDVFTKQEPVLNAVNMTLQPDGATWFKNNMEEDGWLEYKITAKDSNPIYAYFPSEKKQSVNIEINGEDAGKYFDYFRHNIVYLGSYSAGEEITFKIKTQDSVNFNEALFYSENLEYLAAYATTIGAGNAELEKLSSSHLTGNVTVLEGHERLMMTVPYQEGWNIYIDGEKIDYTTAFGTFISLPVSAGTHEIELKFSLPYFGLGLAVSILSILSAVIAAFYKQIKEKINSWR